MKQKERRTKWYTFNQFVELLKTSSTHNHKKPEIRRTVKAYSGCTYKIYYAIFCKK